MEVLLRLASFGEGPLSCRAGAVECSFGSIWAWQLMGQEVVVIPAHASLGQSNP